MSGLIDDLLNSVSSPPPGKEEGSTGELTNALPDLSSLVPSKRSRSFKGDLTGDPLEIAGVLAEGWIDFFSKWDHQVEWLDIEREFLFVGDGSILLEVMPPESITKVDWLDEHTALTGKVDANGRRIIDSDTFFGEWKSQSPPPKSVREHWKQTWRQNPQSRTYGVVAEEWYPGTRRFTVRKAFKSNPPDFDWAWFTFTTEEIQWWREELLRIAHEIRRRRANGGIPWSPALRPQTCFWHENMHFPCPYFENGCSKLDWRAKPENAIERTSHLAIERELIEKMTGTFNQKLDKKLVILGASRVDTYRGCPERFRKDHEEGLDVEKSEALAVGKGLHSILEKYYRKLVKGE